MKLPKQFRGGDLNGMLKDLKESIEKAEAIEAQLKDERIVRSTPYFEVTADGTGKILKIKNLGGYVFTESNDENILRDIELLAGEAFDIAIQRREALTEEVLGKIPG